MRLKDKTAAQLLCDLRDVFGLYDLEILFDYDPDARDDEEAPRWWHKGGGADDPHMYIKFRRYDWKPKRAKEDRSEQYAKARAKYARAKSLETANE